MFDNKNFSLTLCPVSRSRLAGLRVAGYSAGLRSYQVGNVLLRYWAIWQHFVDSIAKAACPSCALRDIHERHAIGKSS